jgi:hypothetical protein
MKVNTKSIVMSLALVLIGNQARSEHETAATELSVLNQQSGRQNRFSDEMIDETSRKLTTILPQINFEPDYGPQRDSDAANPNGATAIKEITGATLAILRSEKVKSLGAKDNQSPSLKAVDEVVAKLDAAMDPNWKHLPVVVSVMPPAVTPNASAGMNPDAVSGSNQLESIQQPEEWSTTGTPRSQGGDCQDPFDLDTAGPGKRLEANGCSRAFL